jgi:multidrug efflux pump subunit AcrB
MGPQASILRLVPDVRWPADGDFSYFNLGREEDPSFTIKTMVIQTRWPGATQDETLYQVTDRIEKKLEELDSLDYTKATPAPASPRSTCTCATPPRPRTSRKSGTRCARRSRTFAASSPGYSGPAFNDEFGDVFGSIYAFTADGLTLRQLRDYVEQARAEVRDVPNIGKIELVGTQDEVLYLNFSTRKLAALGIDQRQVMQACNRRTR